MVENPIQIPKWFLFSAGIALVWNLLGVLAFFDQLMLSNDQLAAMTAAEQRLYRNIPYWATAAYGIAVFAGAIGALLLLLQRSMAKILLWGSFIAVLIQMFHAFVLANAFDVVGFAGLVMPIFVIIVAMLLIKLAHTATSKTWLH